VVNAFRSMDSSNKGKLKSEEFIEACKNNGFEGMNRAIFHGLDWKGNKYLMAEDLSFLDSWRCPQYLVCKPNQEAADDFVQALLRTFDNPVKAWRLCLDRDNSNCVAWEEFEAAAKKIGFRGDLFGAWRSLDDDLSGFITLNEIDKHASELLFDFKNWADEEFGGVRHAFDTLDADGSGEMTFKEFVQATHAYGFQGDAKLLFDALDSNRNGMVALNEISFMDGWYSPSDTDVKDEETQIVEDQAKEAATKERQIKISQRIHQLAVPRSRAATPRAAQTPGKMDFTGPLPLRGLAWELPRPQTSPYARLPKVSPRKSKGDSRPQTANVEDNGAIQEPMWVVRERLKRAQLVQTEILERSNLFPEAGQLEELWLEKERTPRLYEEVRDVRNRTAELRRVTVKNVKRVEDSNSDIPHSIKQSLRHSITLNADTIENINKLL